MSDLLFQLALVLTAGAIYLLTGRNRRQAEKVPEGMVLLCPPPQKRYVVYALGVLVLAVVLGFGVLYLLDGAPEAARPMWGLCVAVAVLSSAVLILCGNVMARDCVYFDREKLQIEKAFRKPQIVRWSEVQRIEGSFDNAIHLYRLDGTKVLTADVSMVNYKVFRGMVKVSCPKAAEEYYRAQTDDAPQKCTLRYGGEYALLAGMGVLVLLVYLALLASAGDPEFVKRMVETKSPGWFAVWFAPLCGAAGAAFLFVFWRTKIRFSREKLVFFSPLRRSREVYWREVQRIEVVREKRGERKWQKLRFFTGDEVYQLNLSVLTWGKDRFLTTLYDAIERYDIDCEEAPAFKR